MQNPNPIRIGNKIKKKYYEEILIKCSWVIKRYSNKMFKGKGNPRYYIFVGKLKSKLPNDLKNNKK